MNHRILQRRWIKLAAIWGGFTLLGLFDASLCGMYYSDSGRNVAWWQTLAAGMIDWYVWAALTPLILWLAAGFPFQRDCWRRSVAIHLGVSLFFTLLVVLFDTEFIILIDFPTEKPKTFKSLFIWYAVGRSHLYLFIYWTVVVIRQLLEYLNKYQERELQASQLQARLIEAQLQVLKMQLHPHFLFNTLNAISSLIHQDVEVADRMITRLGDLLRSTLDNAGTQEVQLRQELEFINPYLEIEQTRLGERMQVVMDIQPEALDAYVPNLILQPLVENAIHHGIAPRAGRGRLEIHAWRGEDDLHLLVRDDGPGLSPVQQHEFKPGVGVANTRSRLDQLYGGTHRFEMKNGGTGGLTVSVVIPFRETLP